MLPFDSDDEGIALANDTPYGLAASAWSRDVYRAGRATREIKAGCVWINDHIPIISEMPHGGYKASGFGKDMSAYSFEEYTQVKHVMYDNTAVAAQGLAPHRLRGPLSRSRRTSNGPLDRPHNRPLTAPATPACIAPSPEGTADGPGPAAVRRLPDPVRSACGAA